MRKKKNIHQVYERIFQGGMPNICTGESERNAYYKAYIDTYIEKGTKTVGRKQYEAERSIKRYLPYGSHVWIDFEFIYREQIYTDGDFDYNFPEY